MYSIIYVIVFFNADAGNKIYQYSHYSVKWDLDVNQMNIFLKKRNDFTLVAFVNT